MFRRSFFPSCSKLCDYSLPLFRTPDCLLLLQFLAEDCILNYLLSEYYCCSIFLFFVYTKGKVSPGLSFETDADFAFLSFVSRRARLLMSFDFSEKLVSFVCLEVESIMDVTFPYADWLVFDSSSKALMSIY